MRRRDFITFISGSALSWPLMVHAQQADRIPRIGVLMAHPENDPEYQSYLNTFRQELAERGWKEGRNIKIDSRWGALDDPETREQSARELLALSTCGDLRRSHSERRKTKRSPVQAPVKFELVINLKTAKTLGLDVPPHIQEMADLVIE